MYPLPRLSRFGGTLFIALLITAILPDESGGVEIVKNGMARAVMVTDPGASRQTNDSAALLARYIEMSTGAAIPRNGEKPEFLTIRLNLKDVPAGSIVYIDDVGLYPQQ